MLATGGNLKLFVSVVGASLLLSLIFVILGVSIVTSGYKLLGLIDGRLPYIAKRNQIAVVL